MQFAVAEFNKLRAQYLGEIVYWRAEVKKVLAAVESDANTAALQLLCYLPFWGFSEEKLVEWYAFEQVVIVKATDFEFGKDSVILWLTVKHCILILNCKENLDIKITWEYFDFIFVVAEEVRKGSIRLVNYEYNLQDHHFQEIYMPLDIFATFQASDADFQHLFGA